MYRYLINILGILPLLLNGQTKSKLNKDFKMNPSEVNKLFDKAILDNTSFPIQKSNTFPIGQFIFTKDKYKIEFEPKEDIYANEVKKYLDNDDLNDEEKITFIKDCLNYKSRDVFSDIESRTIDFWKINPEAKLLIENYFLNKIAVNPTTKDKYFHFRIKHQYLESYDLIKNHFKNRNVDDIQYINEGEILYYLAKLGNIEEALEYLEILFNDLKANKIKYVTLGQGWGHSEEFENNIFTFFLKSENLAIKEKAINLLCRFIELGGNYKFNLSGTLSVFDFERFKTIRYEKFNSYKKIDFSKVKIETIKEQEDLLKILPESREYFDDLINDAKNIGKYYGLEIWSEFNKNKEFWRFSGNSITFAQVFILENLIRVY